MATDTLTLVLAGRVSLAHFATATANFRALVVALSCQIGAKTQIDWDVDDLQPGGITTTAVGQTPNQEVLDAIVRAYECVGESLRESVAIPYGERVSRPAKAIARLLNGNIPSITFETANKDVVLVSGNIPSRQPDVVSAHGMVEGQVQTLTSRAGLRFALYGKLFDTAVSCYVERGREELLRGMWGHRATVEGWVTRDYETGKPLSVRRIKHIEIVPATDPGHYLRARGASPLSDGEESADVVIRKIRDAWVG